jgi:copper transport protein
LIRRALDGRLPPPAQTFGRRRAAVCALLAAAFAALALLPAGTADAHAVLVRADPPVNSQLRESPAAMTLYFSEAVERKISNVKVLDGNKKQVDAGFEFDDADSALMRVKLNKLDAGYYTVQWETLSRVDGHRIAGSYPITVLRPDGSLPPGTNPNATGATATVSGTEAKPERVVTRWALLLGAAAVVGAIAFIWVAAGISGQAATEARETAVNRLVSVSAVGLGVLAVAGFIDLLLQANLVFGSVGKFPEVISDTRWGQFWIARNMFVPPLAVGMVAFYRQGLDSRLSGFVTVALTALGLGYLATTSAVSHAGAGTGSFWATSFDFVHLVAASVWIGLLLQVALTIRWARREVPRAAQPVVIAAALRRFSLLAVLSIALLLFTGVVNAVIELDQLGDLTNGDGYGLALLIKLLLLLPLLAAGGANAYLFRPQVVEEAERAQSRRRGGVSEGWEDLESTLTRTIRIEGALAAVVLLVVAVLVQLNPTRNALAAPTQTGKFTETKQVQGLGVTLNIDPNRSGNNTFETYLTGDAGSVERVELLFLQDKKGAFESSTVLQQSNTPLYYVGGGAFINDGGKWKVTVNLRRGNAASTDLSVPFEVEVAGPSAAATSREGGSFDSPRSFSAAAIALMVATGALSVALVIASLDKPDRPAGLMGDIADRLAGLELRPGISLAALVLVGIGLGILVGTHTHQKISGNAATKGNPVASSPASIARGQELFLQNCTQCHGESGRGDGPLAPTLRLPPANLYDHIPYHPDQFFFDIITNGYAGVMPAFGTSLTDEDRWNLLNYLRSRFGTPPAAQ